MSGLRRLRRKRRSQDRHLARKHIMAKVLLIDDEPEFRTFVQRILECDGHNVTVADSRKFVAEAVTSGDFVSRFDIVVTDLLMPDIDSLETIYMLKRVNPEARIIAMSGGGQLGAAEGCLQVARRLGADRTLLKPFSVAELQDAMGELLAAV